MAESEGGCLCGAVRYAFEGAPVFQVACHCRDCQYASGGGPALIAVVPKPAFRITRGQPRTYWSKGDSGADVGRSFCPECGAPVFSEPKAIGEIVAVKVGSLDDPSAFRPQADIWMKSAQPWHQPHEGAAQFETAPPRAG
ncbi:MAG TPA: GFA family protein [Caulobacteraceae bacterium]|nr:GFA family protein [Caulobacteraceae bacterium]